MNKNEILLAPPDGASTDMVRACNLFNAFAGNHGGEVDKVTTLLINGEDVPEELQVARSRVDTVTTATDNGRMFDLAIVAPTDAGKRKVINDPQASDLAWAMIYSEDINPGHATLSNAASCLASRLYVARLELREQAHAAELKKLEDIALQQRHNLMRHSLGFVATTRTGLPFIRPRIPKAPRPYKTITD